MASKYLKPGAGGTDSGTLPNPWLSLDSAGASAVAGDEVLSNGTDALSSTAQFDNSGAAGSNIHYIGVNSSWDVEEGTYFTVDGDATATTCLDGNGKSYTVMENFVFDDATDDNVIDFGAYTLFYNCIFQNAGDRGYTSVNIGSMVFWRCQFLNNTGHGLHETGNGDMFIECFFNGNGANDLYLGPNSVAELCVFTNPATRCIECNPNRSLINQCILNNSGNMAYQNAGGWAFIKNSIISNMDGTRIFYAADVMASNVAYYSNSATKLDAGATYENLPYGSSDITLSADPYVNEGADDLNIALPNADLTNVEGKINDIISNFATIGIAPEYVKAGGGIFGGSIIR